MKAKYIFILLTVMALTILACAFVIPSSSSVPSSTPTEPLAPTSTASATKTSGPTVTPKPTFTPRPDVVLVIERPPGSAFPVKITDAIWKDFRQENIPEKLFTQRVVWVADIKFNDLGGRVLLSGASDGMKPLVVDDVLRITVIHSDGTTDFFEHNFAWSSTIPQGSGPYDLTDYFRPGLNMLYVEIFDYYYSAWGTDGIWIVEFK